MNNDKDKFKLDILNLKKNPISIISLSIVILLPLLYLFSLKNLAIYGFANLEIPDCKNKLKSCDYRSVSSMILTPQATGAFAFIIYPAFLSMWVYTLKFNCSNNSHISLGIFQMSFYSIIMFPVSTHKFYHLLSVLIFGISGFYFYYNLQNNEKNDELDENKYVIKILNILLYIILLCFAIIILLIIVNNIIPTKNPLVSLPIFWIVESIGLVTGISYIPLLLILNPERLNDISRDSFCLKKTNK